MNGLCVQCGSYLSVCRGYHPVIIDEAGQISPEQLKRACDVIVGRNYPKIDWDQELKEMMDAI